MVLHRSLLAFALLPLLAGAPLAARAEATAPTRPLVELDPLTSTVLLPNGRHGVMMVQASLNVPDITLRRRLGAYEPKLRDAYVQVLTVYSGHLSPGAPPNADYVVQLLQQQTDRVLARPGAQVILGGIMIN